MIIQVGGRFGLRILDGVRRDLGGRRARWAVGAVELVGAFGLGLHQTRCGSSTDREPEYVAALRSAREDGPDAVRAVLDEPRFRVSRRRIERGLLISVGVAAVTTVGHRVLLQELKRRGVRRPHLMAGLTVGTVEAGLELASRAFDPA
ncbi:hypothetical protein [Microlunatus sp. GCM10028923]|uniref:hypothetical protein n=1 Tax=Microlunatus sp. GCM10028923 TaxID=3273400 RepID=UPI00361DB399